jgi:hypothetical protein
MSPEANAFQWAEFLIESGVPCEDLMEQWMLGVTEMGLRYCPLAEELILGECPDEEREPSEEEEVGREAAVECEALANSLAELEQRGEIVLSEEALQLVIGVLAGEDVEGLANTLAELDQRGEISLSDEELSLVRCVLGVEEEIPCEGLANSLAELEQRGEIVLSDEAVELVKGVLAGEDVEGLANSLAELDQRGEISLSEEELSLVRCVLGVEEVVKAVEVEVEVIHVGAVFAEFHCDGPDGSVDRDCLVVFTVVASFEQARFDAVLWAYRSPRHVLIYSDESRAVLLADVRGY